MEGALFPLPVGPNLPPVLLPLALTCGGGPPAAKTRARSHAHVQLLEGAHPSFEREAFYKQLGAVKMEAVPGGKGAAIGLAGFMVETGWRIARCFST